MPPAGPKVAFVPQAGIGVYGDSIPHARVPTDLAISFTLIVIVCNITACKGAKVVLHAAVIANTKWLCTYLKKIPEVL